MDHKTRLGPIAIFLTIVAMVITTLAVLTVATSNADRVMAGRFASITQTRYELEAGGERFLAAAAAGDISGIEGAQAGPIAEEGAQADQNTGEEGAQADGDAAYSYVNEKDGYRLEVEITAPDAAGNFEITKWKVSRIWNSKDLIGDIWQGF